jgi:hypothetical protein
MRHAFTVKKGELSCGGFRLTWEIQEIMNHLLLTSHRFPSPSLDDDEEIPEGGGGRWRSLMSIEDWKV